MGKTILASIFGGSLILVGLFLGIQNNWFAVEKKMCDQGLNVGNAANTYLPRTTFFTVSARASALQRLEMKSVNGNVNNVVKEGTKVAQ